MMMMSSGFNGVSTNEGHLRQMVYLLDFCNETAIMMLYMLENYLTRTNLKIKIVTFC